MGESPAKRHNMDLPGSEQSQRGAGGRDVYRWIRLFNRLEVAVRRHREGKLFKTEEDDELYAAHDKVLKAASDPGGLP